MITIRGLTKAYRRQPVLRGLSLEARPGEITLLVGPNGAGKSTTLRILAGLARADAGEAHIAGREIGRERLAAQAQLSFLPQTAGFHPRFTCAEILEFYARVRGCAAGAAGTALARAGLAGLTRVRTGELSGGLRQRLGLAVLLLPDAPVLLLDEPDLSLDPEWRRRLQELLHQEAHRGKTVLVTTHLLAEWNEVAHRCLLCQEGVIARELDPANLADTFEESGGGPARPGPAAGGVAASARPIRPWRGKAVAS